MKIAIVFILVLGCRQLAAHCPKDWQRFGESCYHMIPQRVQWLDARSICAQFRASIAVPNSFSEHQYLWQLFNGKFDCKDYGGLWIGCIETEGVWQPCPLKNEGQDFQKWQVNQPDNSGTADCAVMSKWYHSEWDDQGCDQDLCAVCELPIGNTRKFCLQTGKDGRPSPRHLVGHVMGELPGKGVVSCGKACRSHLLCRSFNLLMEPGPGKTVCQLNNATRHEAAERDIKAKENCYMFEL